MEILIHLEQRRVDLRWVERKTPPRWLYLTDWGQQIQTFLSTRLSLRDPFARRENSKIAVGSHSVDIGTKTNDIGIRVFDCLYLFPESKVASFLKPYFERAAAELSNEDTLATVFFSLFVQQCIRLEHVPDPQGEARKLMRTIEESYPREMSCVIEILDNRQLLSLVEDVSWTVFDPSVWARYG
jgi:hypothetical protein